MRSFNSDATELPPYIIDGGNIYLGPELETATGYGNPIKITDIGDLRDELKVDEHGVSALSDRLDIYEDIDEGNLKTIQEIMNARREFLGSIMVDLMGVPVVKLSEHRERVDVFCSDYIDQN